MDKDCKIESERRNDLQLKAIQTTQWKSSILKNKELNLKRLTDKRNKQAKKKKWPKKKTTVKVVTSIEKQKAKKNLYMFIKDKEGQLIGEK